MTIAQFAKRYNVPETGRNTLTHYRKSRIAAYQVVRYPDGEVVGEIYRKNGRPEFIMLAE